MLRIHNTIHLHYTGNSSGLTIGDMWRNMGGDQYVGIEKCLPSQSLIQVLYSLFDHSNKQYFVFIFILITLTTITFSVYES